MQDPVKEEIRKAVNDYLAKLDKSSRISQFFAPHWQDKIASIVKPAMLELKEHLSQLAIRSRIADKDGNDDYAGGPYIGMVFYPINKDGHRNFPVISFQSNSPDVLMEVSYGSPKNELPSITARQLKLGQITKESMEAELKDFVVNSMKSWSRDVNS